MRSAEITLGRLQDRGQLSGRTSQTSPWTPRPVGTKPAAYLPHPPMVSGDWQQSRSDQEKSVAAALAWTLFFGPFGLFYISTTAGLVATTLTTAALVVTGSAIPVAIIWPIVMLWSVVRTR